MCLCVYGCVCNAYWHLHTLTNLILFSFSPFKSWAFLTDFPGNGKFSSNFSDLMSWCTSEIGRRFRKREFVLERRSNLQMHDHCGLYNMILHTSSPKNQIHSWSRGCFWVFASCRLCIWGKLMERPLITGWLVVEFPDCKEQTVTFKRGWVCVRVGWRMGQKIVRFAYYAVYHVLGSVFLRWLICSKTLPHAAVVNQKNLL